MNTEDLVNIWVCPVCQLPLVQSERQWRCGNGHSFDIAKEGYTNLLLANQKRSSDPGDTKEMMASRRAFLSAGHYQPLADKLTELLGKHLSPNACLLDSGCGESYYLQQLFQHRNDLNFFGIDISRDAVKLASRQFKAGSFAVASSFHLPVLSSSADAVLRIFAPGDAGQVRRVLKSEGIFVVVSPGPRHLFALKQMIYKEALEHTLPDQAEGFRLLEEHRVNYPLEVKGEEAVKQLLSMTPFYWKGDRTAKAKLDKTDVLCTDVDFLIRVYVPANNQPPVANPAIVEET